MQECRIIKNVSVETTALLTIGTDRRPSQTAIGSVMGIAIRYVEGTTVIVYLN